MASRRAGWLVPVAVALGVLLVVAAALLLRPGRTPDAASLAPPPPAPVVDAVPTTEPAPPLAPVPEAELPPATCSALGLQVSAGPVDGAMGLRASGLTLTNCGSQPRDVTGYAAVQVLDEDGVPLQLAVVTDPAQNTFDAGPVPLVLQPGDQAHALLTWRLLVEYGEVQEGAAVLLTPVPGDSPSGLPMRVDVGTRAQVELSAWSAGT